MKAPGPDDFMVLFFQKYWTTVRGEVISMVKHFFSNGYMLKKLNHSFIALIPKHGSLVNISQFRPISLCNVCYKVISKILATRLKEVLPKLISCNQMPLSPIVIFRIT